MAQAGMARWRGKNPSSGPAEGDEVQRSLELLDRVLSEFDDLENGNVAESEGAWSRAPPAPTPAPVEVVSTTPEDESPSLGGHQSEDDGYMSMNGRRAKFMLSFRPVEDEGPSLELPPPPDPPPDPSPIEMADFPPPPEEAERIISTLLPRVSPGNSAKRSHVRREKPLPNSMTIDSLDHHFHDKQGGVTTATQTTLPKTKHQRPFGWETDVTQAPFHLKEPPNTQHRFGSLPYDGALQYARFPPPWLQRPGPLPPRTVPGVIERHREVRRRNSGDTEASRCGGEEPCPPLRTLDELSDDDRANFSDDSLEELLPPVITCKRNSIAWEVPVDDCDPLLTPGSTKVVGRRRRKSGEHSSTSSIHRLRDHEDWPDHPISTEDETASPFSEPYYDSSVINDESNYLPTELTNSQITPNGTYVIRKGRKKERKPVSSVISPPEVIQLYQQQPKFGDLKRCSSTFDNIKSLLKEGLLEGLDDAPPDFTPPAPPTLVRVVSLPTLTTEDNLNQEFFTVPRPERISREDSHHRLSRPQELEVTMEEEEDQNLGSNTEDSSDNPNKVDDFRRSDEENKLIMLLENDSSLFLDASNESLLLGSTELLSISDKLLGSRYKDTLLTRSCHTALEHSKRSSSCEDSQVLNHKLAVEVDSNDPWVTTTEIKDVEVVDVVEELPPKDYLDSVCSSDDYKVTVSVVQHEFPPLPPSPVEEDDDEYSEIVSRSPMPTPRGELPAYRSLEPCTDASSSRYQSRPCPPEPTSSLKTRSMDAGFTRGHRGHGSKRDIPAERRTLPTELPGPLRRRTFQKRSSAQSPQETLQTSCSLPETPIFARGCDIPRTPHRRAPDVPGVARTAPRPAGLATSGGYRRMGSNGHGTTSTSLGQALVGAELLRLAGGPGRGWYPRHRQQTRPASIEHLDRLSSGHSPGHNLPSPWDARDTRKPLTLPPNLSPKFFHRSPREALRRVTSLLIRKGNNPKESKKETMSPTGASNGEASGEDRRQKRGFFKSFWKKSRHYSLEHQ